MNFNNNKRQLENAQSNEPSNKRRRTVEPIAQPQIQIVRPVNISEEKENRPFMNESKEYASESKRRRDERTLALRRQRRLENSRERLLGSISSFNPTNLRHVNAPVRRNFNVRSRFSEVVLPNIELFNPTSLRHINVPVRVLDFDVDVSITMNVKRLKDSGVDYEYTLRNKTFTIPNSRRTDIEYIKSILREYLEAEESKEIYPGMILEISNISTEVLNVRRNSLANYPMNGTRLESVLLSKMCQLNLSESYDGLCVVKYLLQMMLCGRANNRYSSVTYERLSDEIMKANKIKSVKGLSVNQVKKWLEVYKYEISMYALEAAEFTVFEKYIPQTESRLVLSFIVCNGHLYPITDKSLVNEVVRSGKINESTCSKFKESFSRIETDRYKYIPMEDIDNLCLLADGKLDEPVVYTNADLMNTMIDITAKTSSLIYNMRIKESEIYDFTHPITGQIVVRSKDFLERKEVCEKLYEMYPCNEFRFRKNQSWGAICNALASILIGNIPKTEDNHIDTSVLDGYSCFAINQNFDLKSKTRDTFSIDHNMCYVTVLRENQDPFPLFTCMDELVPFNKNDNIKENCQYIVNAFKSEKFGFERPIELVSYRLVSYYLSKKYIKKSDILYVREARKILPHDIFSKLIDFMYANFDKSIVKKMLLPFIGLLGIKLRSSELAYVTGDYDEALSLYIMKENEGCECSIYRHTVDSDLSVLRFSKNERMLHNNRPIWTQVICGANLRILEKAEELVDLGFTIEAIKTDAIFIKGDYSKITDEVLGNCWKIEKGKMKPMTSWVPKRDHVYMGDKNWHVVNKGYLQEKLMPCFINGPGGSGKSHFIVDKAIKQSDKKIIMCAFTNSAVNNLRRKCWKLYKNQDGVEPEHIEFMTLDSMLAPNRKNLKADMIIVDEVSTVSKNHMNKLASIKDVEFIFLGDFNQCPPVEADDGTIYSYQESRMFKLMCKNVMINFEYNKDYARNDEMTYEVSQYLLKTGKLHPALKGRRVNSDLKANVTRTRAMRKEINDKFDGFNYFVGQKIIMEYNSMKEIELKKAGIYNSEFYEIEEIFGDEFKLKGKNHLVKKRFIQPAYAVTVYKYQGSEINEPFNIMEVDKMCIEELYTALTRARRFEDIHLDFTDKTFEHYKKNVSMLFVNTNKPYKLFAVIDKPEDDRVEAVPEHDLKYVPIYNYDDLKKTMKEMNSESFVKRYGEMKQEDILIREEGMFYDTTSRDIDKTIAELKEEPYECIKRVNLIEALNVESLIEIKETNRGFRIQKTLNGKKIDNVFTTKEKAEQKRRELLKQYYLPLVDQFESEIKVSSFDINPAKDCGDRVYYEPEEEDDELVDSGDADIPSKFHEFKKGNDILSYMKQRNWYRRDKVPYTEVIHSNGNKILVKWVEKKSKDELERAKWYAKRMNKKKIVEDKHFYTAMTRKELIDILVDTNLANQKLSNKDKYPLHLFETMEYNVRLLCDVDCSCDHKTLGINPIQIRDRSIELITEVARSKGVELKLTDFRVLDATTAKKISFHISVPSQVFENHTYQRAFWEECEVVAQHKYPDLYIKENDIDEPRFVFDTTIYGHKRAMRTIFSEKDGKKNNLNPYIIPYMYDKVPEDLKSIVREMVEQHLSTSDRTLCYSKLSVKPEQKGSKKHSARHVSKNSYNCDLTPALREELSKIKIPDGFDINNSKMRSDTLVWLERVAPSKCDSCNRTHERDNAYLYKVKNKWNFRCMKQTN